MIDVLDQGAFGTGAGPACRAGPGAQPVGRRAPTQSGTPLPPRSSQSNSINTQHLFFIHKQAPNAVIDTSATRASEVNVGSMQHWRIARLAHACPASYVCKKKLQVIHARVTFPAPSVACQPQPQTWPAFTITTSILMYTTSFEITHFYHCCWFY